MKAAQESFHEQGFHGSSVDAILDRAGATKGGMYHHFPDKDALGAAVVEERLLGLVEARWGDPGWHADPLTHLQGALGSLGEQHLLRGCPVNSFAQEVSFHKEELREGLSQVFERWTDLIADGLRAGVARGMVQADIDPQLVATYYLAVWEGLVALAKVHRQGPAFIARALTPLLDYLESLRG